MQLIKRIIDKTISIITQIYNNKVFTILFL